MQSSHGSYELDSNVMNFLLFFLMVQAESQGKYVIFCKSLDIYTHSFIAYITDTGFLKH